MSVMQLTEYLLWKSIKHKTVSSSVPANLKGLQQNHQEVIVNDICRVCTNPAEIPITDKFDDIIIMSAIRTVANISMHETDDFPKYVCKICLGELKIAFQFKKKCETSDMMFRKALSCDTALVTNSQPMVKHDFSLILHQMKQKRLSLSMAIKHEETNDDEIDIDEMLMYTPSKCLNVMSQTEKTASPVKREKQSPVNDMTTHNGIITINSNCDNDNDNFNETVATDTLIRKEKKLLKTPKCKRCDLKFDTKEEFQKHRKNNSCVYHPCPQCGKLVLNLASHEKIVHSRPNKYTCHQCGKIYYSSGALINHMHIHKDTKEYFCEHCPYRGKRKSYLVCHMRVHTGEHRYLCSMCPLKFTNPSNLSKHQLIHFNKKFECSKCKRLFRQERNLKEHFDAAHLNIRYRCSICGRDLISRKKLLNHELRVHKREKHKLFEDEVQRIVIGNDND